MAQGYQYRLHKFDWLTGHDATQPICVTQEVCSNYTWNITICFDGIVGGPPILTVNVSNDGVKFFQYTHCATNETADTFAFFDSIMAFPYIQFCYDPNGVTGGTVDSTLILKPIQ